LVTSIELRRWPINNTVASHHQRVRGDSVAAGRHGLQCARRAHARYCRVRCQCTVAEFCCKRVTHLRTCARRLHIHRAHARHRWP
jgi:hypothetical protein